MSAKPSFAVAAVGLEPEHLRLIAIVFRHIEHNRYLFRLVAPDGVDTADVLIARVSDAGGRAALERARMLRRPRASVGVLAPGDAAPGRHAIELGQLVRQLLPILNRVVEIEGLVVPGADAPAPSGAVPAPAESGATASASVWQDSGSEAAAAPAGPVAPAAPRVLVIDRCPTTGRELTESLASLGCRVESVYTGAAALDRLSAGGVDLATLDVDLPDGDGLRLARTIRAVERWRTLPLVVLSERRSALDVIRSAWIGCSAYLAKPVDRALLRRTVEAQLGANRPDRPPSVVPPGPLRAGG